MREKVRSADALAVRARYGLSSPSLSSISTSDSSNNNNNNRAALASLFEHLMQEASKSGQILTEESEWIPWICAALENILIEVYGLPCVERLFTLTNHKNNNSSSSSARASDVLAMAIESSRQFCGKSCGPEHRLRCFLWIALVMAIPRLVEAVGVCLRIGSNSNEFDGILEKYSSTVTFQLDIRKQPRSASLAVPLGKLLFLQSSGTWFLTETGMALAVPPKPQTASPLLKPDDSLNDREAMSLHRRIAALQDENRLLRQSLIRMAAAEESLRDALDSAKQVSRELSEQNQELQVSLMRALDTNNDNKAFE